MSLTDLQRLMVTRGHRIDVDGIWGPETERAVRAELKPAVTVPPVLPVVIPAIINQPRAARRIDEIIFHCTAGFNPPDAAGIRKMHMTPGWQGSPHGWADIGYHYVVKVDGTIEAGRPEALIGAHVLGHNTGTLGVVYVGGIDADGDPKDTRTPAQKIALMNVRNALMTKYPTISRISGHNQYSAKACPSFYVPTDPLGKLV